MTSSACWKLALVGAMAAMLAACGPEKQKDPCEQLNCPSGSVCQNGACVAMDAGAGDEDAGTDAGGIRDDAGVIFDGGADAGTDTDAGMEMDAGMGMDAGMEDAGVEQDAGMEVDAGTASDAGMEEDAGIEVDAGTPDAGPNTSQQIADVRAQAGDAGLALPIQGALVTYVIPAIGNDPEGFFLQADQNGPAIFVMLDAGVLPSTPQRGDRVDLEVNAVGVLEGRRQITAFSGYTVLSSGNPVSQLAQDISAATDVVSNVENYESELVTATGTLAQNPLAAGADHLSFDFGTMGISGDPSFEFRVPTALASSLELVKDCNITVNATPLWRYTSGSNNKAQVSAWSASDVTVHSCPAPKLLSATATSPTSVQLTFDRNINPTTVTPNGFIFSNNLTAMNATAMGKIVVIDTTTQVVGMAYTVTVASTVQDMLGSSVDPTANTANFIGYATPAVLAINEVAPTQAAGRDLIELYVVSGGRVNGYTLVQNITSQVTVLATLPDITVATGDYIIVHTKPSTSAVPPDAPASETTSKAQYPASMYLTFDDAWDVLGTTNEITFSSRVLAIKDATGAIQDGVPFTRTSAMPPGVFVPDVVYLQDAGLWLPSTCDGGPCTTFADVKPISVVWDNFPDGGVGIPQSNADAGNYTVHRLPNGTDTNTSGDWIIGPSSFGAQN